VVKELAMRQRLRLTLVLTLGICSAGLACKRTPAADPGWQEYAYADDGFALKAPSQPALEKQPQPTASGSIEMRQYSVDLTSDVQVMMSVSDFPNTNRAAPKDILEGAVNGSIQNTKATKVSEKYIELQQVPGIEFEGTTGGYRLLGRYYWNNNRLFALMAVSPLGQPAPPDELKVMDSLRFVTK
jgi:hypothetical protein